MSNPVVAAVRSVIQALVSIAVVALANYVLVELNLTIDAEAITQTLSVAVFGFLVFGFNALGARFPIVNTVLSLGFGAAPPSYEG